jgi:hypothetical protein
MWESIPAKNAAIEYLYHGFPHSRERQRGEFASKGPSQSAVQTPDLGSTPVGRAMFGAPMLEEKHRTRVCAAML